jgi:hypothetical protein
MIKVKDHKKFCCFDYTSEKNNTDYQLGCLVTKDNEVGVIIQTYADGEFRTDRWGNSSDYECVASTISEVQKFRPGLIDELVEQEYEIGFTYESFIKIKVNATNVDEAAQKASDEFYKLKIHNLIPDTLNVDDVDYSGERIDKEFVEYYSFGDRY